MGAAQPRTLRPWDNRGVTETAPRAEPPPRSPAADPTGSPSRYTRSFGGLVGSMIVLVLLVGAFVLVRSQVRVDPEVHPDPVDYLGTVRLAQAAGLDVVYPAS